MVKFKSYALHSTQPFKVFYLIFSMKHFWRNIFIVSLSNVFQSSIVVDIFAIHPTAIAGYKSAIS